MNKALFFIGLISLLVTSCKTYSEEEVQSFDKTIQKFVMRSGLNYEKSESGLYYLIEKEGEGEFIKFTDEVSFRYTGKLLSGKTFDGRYKRTPITFEVSKLIEGWKEGMMYLKKGGKAKLIVPPTLGYGDNQLPDIPANSILYFEIEIVDVR